jgi:hypothetical protein
MASSASQIVPAPRGEFQTWKRAAAGHCPAFSTISMEPLAAGGVAEAWGLTVATYRGSEGRALGYAQPGWQIGLGVGNLSTWAHELVHQAEHRLGALTKRGQDREQEIVAELGGAVPSTTRASYPSTTCRLWSP